MEQPHPGDTSGIVWQWERTSPQGVHAPHTYHRAESSRDGLLEPRDAARVRKSAPSVPLSRRDACAVIQWARILGVLCNHRDHLDSLPDNVPIPKPDRHRFMFSRYRRWHARRWRCHRETSGRRLPTHQEDDAAEVGTEP